MMHSSRRFSRVLAAVCGVAVLLGATACDNSGSTMKAGMGQESGPTLDTDGEPFIHANHDRGVDPKLTLGDINGEEDLDAYDKEILEWGLQQTPDWLEICNTINKHELRQLGIDPQKDLLQREGGEGKRWACGWKHGLEQMVMLGRLDKTLEEASVPPQFYLNHKATVNGRRATVGMSIEKEPLSKTCMVNYYYRDTVYRLVYILPEPSADTDFACDSAIKLATRD